jgi:hypothetical protein
MRRLLSRADFAHSAPVLVASDDTLAYMPGDLARPEFAEYIRQGRKNFISLTGAAHTRTLYERLPHGWHPAPPETPTDLHMWRQVFSLPDALGATSPLITSVHFPNPSWRHVPDSVRAEVVESWLERALRPEGEEELQELLESAVRRAAQDSWLRAIELARALRKAEEELAHLGEPRWRKVGRQALRLPGARAMRERLR